MTSPLFGPEQRYRLAVEALVSQDGEHFTRRAVECGHPLGIRMQAAGAAADGPPSSYLVVVDESCSLILQPGQNGVTVRDVRLLDARNVRLALRVEPGESAPDWLPDQQIHLLFDGDAAATLLQAERYIPLDGMLADESPPSADVAPLDALAVALGRSMERANAQLASRAGSGGLSLVSTVTLRVGVSRVDVGPGRVVVGLARPDSGAVEQYVELTLQAGMATEGEDSPGGAGGGT